MDYRRTQRIGQIIGQFTHRGFIQRGIKDNRKFIAAQPATAF